MRTKIAIVLFVLCLTLPLMAQERGRPGGSSGGGRESPGTSGAGAVATMSSAPSISVSASSAPSRDFAPSFSSASGRGGVAGSSGAYYPRLEGTSFISMNSYYQWQEFFWYLQRSYMMNPSYFSRFYRNREPLVTPTILKLTVRQPLQQSMRMLDTIDELETLLKEKEAGRPVDKLTISQKTKEIRDLAKAIRNDEGLSQIDQRLDRSSFKSDEFDNLGLEAVSRLREVTQDMVTQLRNMYENKEPSTISVQSLQAPSFESMTKGIDKLTKTIDNSMRRL